MNRLNQLALLTLLSVLSLQAAADKNGPHYLAEDTTITYNGQSCVLKKGNAVYADGGFWFWEKEATLTYKPEQPAQPGECAKDIVFQYDKNFVGQQAELLKKQILTLPGADVRDMMSRGYNYAVTRVFTPDEQEQLLLYSDHSFNPVDGKGGDDQCEVIRGGKLKVLALRNYKQKYVQYSRAPGVTTGCPDGSLGYMGWQLENATQATSWNTYHVMTLEKPLYEKEVIQLLMDETPENKAKRFMTFADGYLHIVGPNLPKEFIRQNYRHMTGIFYYEYYCDRRPWDTITPIGKLPDGKVVYRYHRESLSTDPLLCTEGTLFTEDDRYAEMPKEAYEGTMASRRQWQIDAIQGIAHRKAWGEWEVGQWVELEVEDHSAPVDRLVLVNGEVSQDNCKMGAIHKIKILSFAENAQAFMVQYRVNPEWQNKDTAYPPTKMCEDGDILELRPYQLDRIRR